MEIYLPILIAAQIVSLLVVSVLIIRLSKSTGEITDEVKKEVVHVAEAGDNTNFIPLLVHELRSPISIIRGASDLMLHDAQSLSATQIHTLLNQIRSSSDDLMTMVNDILDVSKIEAGKFVLTKTTARLQDTITAVCTYYETLFKLRKIILVLDIQSDMPELSFDPDRIRQVLNNLLSNALKFTPENGTVTVSAHRIDHYVEVSVSDTGPGVASKDKPLLFHKFIQGSNHSATSEKGTGLGLVIVKSIVEAHGGRIWIDDNKPTGAKFIFSLPL